MPKFKVTISLPVYSTEVEAWDKEEAEEIAGEKFVDYMESSERKDNLVNIEELK